MTDSEATVKKAIEAIRDGRMVVLMDDKSRENEGDLCMAAEKVTAESIAFMATHGRGLICLALTQRRTCALDLSLMVRNNRSRFGTNFTVSIDAREGISTGISAADRARTIQLAVHRDTRPEELVAPGHIFPLQSASGGVLERAGQTEGSVDLARMAGLYDAGVICEIMKEDGTMARRPDLEIFCEKFGLVMLDIGDIIQYRLKREMLLESVVEKDVAIKVNSGSADFKLILLRSKIHDHPREYMALVHGTIDEGPTLCRVHVGYLSLDLFGIRGPRKLVSIDESLRMIVKEGKGVFLFLPPRVSILDELKGTEPEREGGLPNSQAVLREFGMGAQVLANLGLKNIRLITRSPKQLYGLEGFGLKVVENVAP
ncbi:MAG: 3,4-dihydroxy-2-butanone-4-phosphate synthase [Pseudomonadota bacterium]